MAIGPVPVPAMPGAMEALTAQMSGMSASDAYSQFMDQQYDGGDDLKIGYTTIVSETSAITGETDDTISSTNNPDPVDAWHDYVENEPTGVSDVTGGVVSGSNASAIALSIMEKTDLSAEAVVPVAIPMDAAIVAASQALGVSIDAAQLDVETKQKFADSIVQSTGMIYDKARDLVLAWKDKLGNILFPKSVVEAVSDTMDEESIGGDERYEGGGITVPFTNSFVGISAYNNTWSYSSSNPCIRFRPSGGYNEQIMFVSLSPFVLTAYRDGAVYSNITASSGGVTDYNGVSHTYYRASPLATTWRSYSVIPGLATPEQESYNDYIRAALFGSVAGDYPEGTSASQATSYTPEQLVQRGSIMAEDGNKIPVVIVNIPENPYDATGSTIDPNSETDDENIGVIYPGLPKEVPDTDDPNSQPKEESSPIPLPIPDTNVSNPDVPLTNASVVDYTLINELVDELADTLDPQPPQSSGIIPIPDMPGIGGQFPSIVPASGSGFIHVYNPTPAEFVSFGNWLWVTYADATIDKIWNNPFDGVLGAHELYATPNRDGRDNIRSGFLTCPTTADLVRNRYSEIDCGTVIVPEFYGNYLDYSPYSQAYIYLPFIGINEVSIDDIVGHAVNIRYRIDSYSGACIAMIFVAKDGYQNICYQFAGNCSVEVPLAGGSQAAIKAGMMQAEAYARAAMPGAVGNAFGGLASGMMGNIGGLISGISGAVSSYANAKAGVEAARVANKSSVQHSGQFGASHGAMGEKIPFIIIRNPIQVKVVNYNDDYGFPAHKRVIIGGCTGYLRVREVNVISAHATDAEKAAIEAMLKNGVYVS